MTVFYDQQAFSLQDYGGVSRIFSELVVGIRKRGNDAHLSLLYSNNTHLKENNIVPNYPFKDSFFLKKRKIVYAVNQIYNVIDIRRNMFDIYHPTYYNPDLIKYVKNIPTVVTFHDMIHERLSGKFEELKADYKLIAQKKDIVNKATHIIAVSENTKKDVVEMYGIDPAKIKVIYLGSSFQSPVISNDPVSQSPYLLYVGNRGLYKNFTPFLIAVAPLLLKKKISFVCAGGKEFTKEEKDLISLLKVENLVRQEAVNDKKLAQFYSNALAFVFPSLYEGFGIPVLEAFACNCPCILSNTSSLPEVAQGAAVYMDPYDPGSMYNAVETILNEPVRNELKTKGNIRLKDFSWEKHVDETLDLYSQLLK
jgi:glycosyltransferase involved in cell wall biosynthesis